MGRKTNGTKRKQFSNIFKSFQPFAVCRKFRRTKNRRLARLTKIKKLYMQKTKPKYTAFRLKSGLWKIKTPSGLTVNAIYLNERDAVKQAAAWNNKQREFSESTIK